MALKQVKRSAVEHAKDIDRFAVICTDGDYEYARTMDEAHTILRDMTAMRDHLAPGNRHEYGVVRVDGDGG